MKAMISQPMRGKTDQEIVETRNKAASYLKTLGYDIIQTVFDLDEDWLRFTGCKQIPVRYLGESLNAMSLCDAVYFCDGWEKARGCLIEHEVASLYGLVCIYEREDRGFLRWLRRKRHA